MRSRGRSFPRAVWRRRASSGPPAAARARAARRASTSRSMCATLARNSGSDGRTRVGRRLTSAGRPWSWRSVPRQYAPANRALHALCGMEVECRHPFNRGAAHRGTQKQLLISDCFHRTVQRR